MKNIAVTLNNIVTLEPMEVWKALDGIYSGVCVPESELAPDDLPALARLIGWCTNQRAYLLSLSAFLEIETKRVNKTGTKEEYTNMVSKKNTVKTYLDMLKAIYDTASRQLTIYQAQHSDYYGNSRGSDT